MITISSPLLSPFLYLFSSVLSALLSSPASLLSPSLATSLSRLSHDSYRDHSPESPHRCVCWHFGQEGPKLTTLRVPIPVIAGTSTTRRQHKTSKLTTGSPTSSQNRDIRGRFAETLATVLDACEGFADAQGSWSPLRSWTPHLKPEPFCCAFGQTGRTRTVALMAGINHLVYDSCDALFPMCQKPYHGQSLEWLRSLSP